MEKTTQSGLSDSYRSYSIHCCEGGQAQMEKKVKFLQLCAKCGHGRRSSLSALFQFQQHHLIVELRESIL